MISTVISTERDGLIYFPDFCHFVLGKLREDQPTREAEFHMEMFKILCGTEPLPTNREATSSTYLISIQPIKYENSNILHFPKQT